MKKFITAKLILSFIMVLISASISNANPTQRCENQTEFFTPLATLFIDNATNPPVQKLCIHLDKARIYNKIDGNESEVIRQLNIIIRISNNQTPDNISQGAADVFIAESQRLILLLGGSIVPPDGLPADPGEAGKATIEGIDSDGDGVRDDVQIFIAQMWPESERTQAMMTMGAKQMQHQLVIAHDKTLARAHVDGMGEGHLQYLCFGYMEWTYEIDGYKSLVDELRPQILNTWDRRDRYTLFGKQLSGMATDHGPNIPFKKGKPYCDFDPAILPN